MHMNLNYARHHWTKPGENPRLGLILCAEKGAEKARYALENLPNKILAAIWAHFCNWQSITHFEASFIMPLPHALQD